MLHSRCRWWSWAARPMPKLYIEVALDGTFRAKDDEIDFTRLLRKRVETVVTNLLDNRGYTPFLTLREVYADEILPDDDVDRDEKLRRIRERRKSSQQ